MQDRRVRIAGTARTCQESRLVGQECIGGMVRAFEGSKGRRRLECLCRVLALRAANKETAVKK